MESGSSPDTRGERKRGEKKEFREKRDKKEKKPREKPIFRRKDGQPTTTQGGEGATEDTPTQENFTSHHQEE